MNVIRKAEAPVFTMIPGLTVTGMASPKRGAKETCVWRVSIAPNTPGASHSVTKEEIFVGLSGQGTITIDGVAHPFGPGDTFIVPAATPFSLANPSTDVAFEAFVTFPVGGKAVMNENSFTPPWAE